MNHIQRDNLTILPNGTTVALKFFNIDIINTYWNPELKKYIVSLSFFEKIWLCSPFSMKHKLHWQNYKFLRFCFMCFLHLSPIFGYRQFYSQIHGNFVHSLWSSNFPRQGFPPCFSLFSIVLVRFFFPFPHVTEQGPNLLHSDNSQSTENRIHITIAYQN